VGIVFRNDPVVGTGFYPYRIRRCLCSVELAATPLPRHSLLQKHHTSAVNQIGWYVNAAWDDEVTFNKRRSFHAIWGWLQVGELPVRGTDLAHKGLTGDDHPHFAPLQVGCRHQGGRNSIYEAAEALSFRPDKPGAGVFSYGASLRLTHPACRAGCRSLWRLPRFLHQRLTPFPKDAWFAEGSFTCVQAAGQNQEYVFERPADGCLDAEIKDWLDGLFQHC
jgi:hypothetical protein